MKPGLPRGVAAVRWRRKPQSPADETRPRAGTLTRADGEAVPLRFVPTDHPNAFLAVTVDGERVEIGPGDRMTVDVLGPGQSVSVDREP